MRRTASEVIRNLEIRVAHLEKKAFLGKIKSSIKDVHTRLLREIPLEPHRRKHLKEAFGRLNKTVKPYINRGGISNIELSPSKSGLVVTFTLNGESETFVVTDLDHLEALSDFRVRGVDSNIVYVFQSVYREVEDDALFFPLLKGETEGLYDQLKDTKFLFQAEKKFWKAFERVSSAGAKILKVFIQFSIGMALFKLIMGAFILIGGGSALLGVILTALVGVTAWAWDKATSSPANPSEWLNRRGKKVDDEEVLENFLELLEQEGIA
tara:strand:- start:585 stop:1385 length:801 start_codon:yes stop_codon:yes gene_type:complete